MRRVLVVCLLLLVVACGKKGRDILKEKKEEMKTFVSTWRTKALAEAPPVSKDEIKDTGGPLTAWASGGTTVLFGETDLKRMDKDVGHRISVIRDHTHTGVEVPFQIYSTVGYSHMAGWAVDASMASFYPTDHDDKDDANKLIERFFAVKFVIVVRLLEYVEPKVLDTQAETRTFVPGHVVADARVFDTQGNEHGGFRYEATNSASTTGDASKDGTQALAGDLKSNLEKAFDAKLKAVLPGSPTADELFSSTR